MELDEETPVIREWCTVCKTYGEHDNGSSRMLRPMDPALTSAQLESTFGISAVIVRTVTRCWNCSWSTIYR